MLRTVGYSAGSALSATILQAHTPVGQALPQGSGYDAAAVLGCGVWVVTAVVSFGLPRWGSSSRSEPSAADVPLPHVEAIRAA